MQHTKFSDRGRVPLKLIRKKFLFPHVSIYLWSYLLRPLCLRHYRQQHLYNTYTPSSYGNLEPSSISPKANLFNSNHHAPIHDNIVRASILHNHPIQRPQPNLSMCLYAFIYCVHSFGHRSFCLFNRKWIGNSIKLMTIFLSMWDLFLNWFRTRVCISYQGDLYEWRISSGAGCNAICAWV